ncbi:MAG: type IV pilus modification PilV family protein [Halothiobacillaceae bacterium]
MTGKYRLPRALIRGRQRGFGLVEAALSLVALSLVGLLAYQAYPRIAQLPLFSDFEGTELVQAEDALLGFAVAQARLPCPDVNQDGWEDCDQTETTGWLPTRTLGMSVIEPIRYGVYRQFSATAETDADLTRLADRYRLWLPPTPPGAVRPDDVINTLDLCRAVGNLASNPQDKLVAGTGGIEQAYALAAGGRDRDASGDPFDGLNRQPGRFEHVGYQARSDYDDRVLSRSPLSLYSQLGCPARMAALEAALRQAYAAYDLHRYALGYEEFREFAQGVREMNLGLAGAAFALASADLVIAIATSGTAGALAIIGAIASGGSLSFAIGVSLASAIAATVAAVAAEVAAGASVVTATIALEKAHRQTLAAGEYVNRMATHRRAAFEKVADLDR